MNKLILNKTLAAGIFAATIITITACGGGGGSSASGSTKITTIAGGGTSTTSTDPTQATLGSFINIVVKDGNFLFNSDRDGTYKLQVLDLATNQLSAKSYSTITAGETLSELIWASADKYYFWTESKAQALYEADSDLMIKHIAGKNDVAVINFIPNDKGKLASFRNPTPQAVLYNDGSADQLFFVDDNKIRKVTLSGDYPTSTLSSKYYAWSLTLKGDKLIVSTGSNHTIFEYNLKDSTEAIVAGSSQGYANAEKPEQAMLKYPSNITNSPSGNIYFSVSGVADDNLRIIRKLAVNNGVYGAVTTAFGAAPDSTADNAGLTNILDLEFVGDFLFLLVNDDNSVRSIKKIEFINQTP